MKEKLLKNKIFEAVVLTLFVGVACLAAQYLVAFPMVFLLGAATVEQPVWTTVYSALTYIVTALIVIFVPKLVKKSLATNREELGLTGLPTFTDIGLSMLGLVATFLFAGILMSLLSVFPWFNATETQELGYSTQVIGLDRVVAFLTLVVIAPFFEELVFRGWLFGKLKNRVSTAVAVALVSILFGALHGQLNVGVTVAVMSVVMCLERNFTGTIYAGVLTHMLKNGIAFYLLFIV